MKRSLKIMVIGTALAVTGGLATSGAAHAVEQQEAWCQITSVSVHDSSLVKKSYDSYFREYEVSGPAILKYQASCPISDTVTNKVWKKYKKRTASGKIKTKWRKVTRTRIVTLNVTTTDYVQENVLEWSDSLPGGSYDALIVRDADYQVGEYTYITVSDSNIRGDYKVWSSLW